MWLNLKAKAATLAGNAMKFLGSKTGMIAIAVVALYGLYQIVSKIITQQNKFKQLTGDVAAKIGVEQREMNGLFEALKKTNPESERRKKLLDEMKEKYPDFLDYQKLEKANEEELETARKKANDELARSIMLQKLKDAKGTAMEAITAKQQEVWKKLSGKFSEAEINAGLDKIQEVVLKNINAGKYVSGVFSGASDGSISQVVDEAFGAKYGASGWQFENNMIKSARGEFRALIDTMLENQETVRVLAGFAQGRFGITDADMLGVNGALAGAVDDKTKKPKPDSPLLNTNNATATGGTRSTTINIKIDKGIGDLYFNGTTKENTAEIERNLAESLYRILGIASTAVN
jgi:hypothetical protein